MSYLDDDLAGVLGDMLNTADGVTIVWGAYEAKATWDSFDSDSEDGFGRGMVQARIRATCRTADLPDIARGDTVVVDETSYTVRDLMRQEPDGRVLELTLVEA